MTSTAFPSHSHTHTHTHSAGHRHFPIERSLSQRQLPSGPAWLLSVSTRYRAAIDEVWSALTSAEQIRQWFLPISGELVVGGRYQFDGNAGGEILGCERPHRFAASWEFDGDVSWVEVRLTRERDGGTTVTLDHLAHVPTDAWDEYGPGATGIGWDLSMHGLDHHLQLLDGTGLGATQGLPATLDTVAGQEWLESQDGLRFIAVSSLAWADASIAAGTDPRSAHPAEARVRAAYTGSQDSAVPTVALDDPDELDELDDFSTDSLLVTTLLSAASGNRPRAASAQSADQTSDPDDVWLLGIEIPLEADPAELWGWITDPELLARWSPAVPDRVLTSTGHATVTENHGDEPVLADVLVVETERELVHRWGASTLRWIITESGHGEAGRSVLRLEQRISERDTAPLAAAGWHVCFAVLQAGTAGRLIPRVVGESALDYGWSTLNDRYRRELLG